MTKAELVAENARFIEALNDACDALSCISLAMQNDRGTAHEVLRKEGVRAHNAANAIRTVLKEECTNCVCSCHHQ